MKSALYQDRVKVALKLIPLVRQLMLGFSTAPHEDPPGVVCPVCEVRRLLATVKE